MSNEYELWCSYCDGVIPPHEVGAGDKHTVCGNFVMARKKANPAQKWTDTPPRPGWYWIAYAKNGKWACHSVVFYLAQINMGKNPRRLVCGPIPDPPPLPGELDD